MKVIVFCNEEDYQSLSISDVLSDLEQYYKAEAENTRLKWGKHLTEMLEKIHGTDAADIRIFSLADDGENKIEQIVSETKCDFLVTYGLAGFGFLTLTDNYVYNLLTIPQIHFCTDKEKASLTNAFAINMFFSIRR